MIRNEVIHFIENFQNLGTIKIFTEGCCYWFAKILSLRFKGAIWYNPIQNHFATEIYSEDCSKPVLYDITGEIEKTEEWQNWEYYRKVDELETFRIERDCILKT